MEKLPIRPISPSPNVPAGRESSRGDRRGPPILPRVPKGRETEARADEARGFPSGSGLPDDQKAHDELVRLVDRMLELHRQRAPLPESNERTRIEHEIEATDGRIDEIVCKLYGITEEERRIIEGAK